MTPAVPIQAVYPSLSWFRWDVDAQTDMPILLMLDVVSGGACASAPSNSLVENTKRETLHHF